MQRALLQSFYGVVQWGWDPKVTRGWPGLSCIHGLVRKRTKQAAVQLFVLFFFFFGYVGVGELPNIYLVLQQACHPLQCVPALGLCSFGSLIRTQKLV